MMNQRTLPRLASRLITPGVIVTMFVLLMGACVLGVVSWKAIDARKSVLAHGEGDIRDLARSLAEHASHTIQAVDVAMSGMIDLLKYQNPQPDRFNQFLASTVTRLPQIRELGVLDVLGNWQFSSLAETPVFSNADRDYFIYHRDHTDPGLRINDPLKSRLTGKMTVLLTSRINKADGSFNGVLLAAINVAYFNDFYDKFQLGEHSVISLMRSDGTLLAYWPTQDAGKDLSTTATLGTHLKHSPTGFFDITSPIDGLAKSVGYEQATQYPLVAAVAIPEQELLAHWRVGLVSDSAVAAVLLCSIVLLAALLSSQFRVRLRMETVLRERESNYRLLADNIADVVILLDRRGNFVFVSPSVRSVLDLDPRELIGKSCFTLVHPDDLQAIKQESAELTDRQATRIAMFRTYRGDGSLAWIEINFKLAARADDHETIEVVGVLRDITRRKTMQDELTTLNAQLAQLATTDGLTGLANRRTLDGFLHQQFQQCAVISVLLFDIDNFKGFNDNLGHQVGDACLQKVGAMLALATSGSPALAARYGGEEFAIIMPNVTEADAMLVAEAMRLKVRALRIANPAAANGQLSVSIGVASRSPRTTTEIALLGEADLALYGAKRRGRDCCVAGSSLGTDIFDGATVVPV
ncbi:sensor domain-containing diguanylate cyclase [soil metagenome]